MPEIESLQKGYEEVVELREKKLTHQEKEQSLLCKFWERHHQFIGFVVAILVCFIINLIALTCTNRTYNDGQQTILKSYKESLALIDSLQKQNEDALNRVLSERERTITKILSDTLIDRIQGLCPKQKEAVRRYVRPYLEVTTRELDVQERIKAYPNQEYQVLRDEIKSLLQLEFNKMQNEYEALEIWAAILTVVFLIFSFYSFFKTEKLEEDGRQSISRINSLEKKAQTDLDDLQNNLRTDFQVQRERFSEAFSIQLHEHQEGFRRIEEENLRRFQDYQIRMEEALNQVRNYGYEQHTDETDNNVDDEYNNISENNDPE